MNKLVSINPANGQKVGEVVISTKGDVSAAIEKAKKVFPDWKRISLIDRVSYVRKFRDLFARHKEELALLTTQEMGKPIKQAREDVDFEVEFIDYYCKKAEEALGDKVVKEDARAIYKTTYEPWGVCASIGPWNFPLSMASSGITAQLIAGNTVIFKPSEYTTLTQKRFVDLFNESGLPKGVLQCIIGDGEVGKMLIDSDINLVWFTGSTAVGQEIYAKCAKRMIKCVVELGGSSPAIVFADTDIEKTIETLYLARFYNCGQVCSAVKRLYVEKPIYHQIVDGLKKRLSKVTLGDPMKDVDLGPLVSKEQLEALVLQVEDAKTKGAKIEIGGEKPQGAELTQGYYYQPTILTNVTSDIRVINEEVFGPVLPIVPFETEEEAIRLANDHIYGLTAEVFTSDPDKGNRVARALEAGGVSVNIDLIYAPECPIGGYKKSGMGREYGLEGFRELAQLKYLCIAK